MPGDGVKVTRHGEKRSRERMGLKKKAVDRNAMIALEKGLKHGETCGGLKRYLDCVKAEEILECNGGEGLALTGNGDSLLGFDGLVQALVVTTAGHETAREGIDDDDLGLYLVGFL